MVIYDSDDDTVLMMIIVMMMRYNRDVRDNDDDDNDDDNDDDDRMITFLFLHINITIGAMYSFPMITLPPAFIAEAKRLNKEPDVLYCLELLNETGLSCVPGSGFQQAPGTFHIRTTILV